MRINTNIAGWLRLFLFAMAAPIYGAAPCARRTMSHEECFDRALRLSGAALLSIVVVYFLGYGLGF